MWKAVMFLLCQTSKATNSITMPNYGAYALYKGCSWNNANT